MNDKILLPLNVQFSFERENTVLQWEFKQNSALAAAET
jgi:hypothetical protein